MKRRFFSAVLAAFVLATASIGVTASAEEVAEDTVIVEETADTAADGSDNADDTEDSTETETTEITTVGEVMTSAAENTDTSFSEEDFSMQDFMKIMSQFAENGGTVENITPDYYGDPYYDTDGNATLIKSESIIYNTEEMQFIAVTTKDGHVFYVLINYSAVDGQDNVYFLNRVDDYDLYALLYAGQEDEDGNPTITPQEALQAAEAANGRVHNDSFVSEGTTENAEDNEDTSEETEPVQSAPVNMNSIYLVVGAAALIGIGAVGFMLTKKKSKGKETVDYNSDDEDDTEITEDEDYDFYDNDEE